MSIHNDELIEELRLLRRRLATEMIALQAAREAYDAQKDEVSAIRKAIEEVLEEIETGSSGRPILDAIRDGSPGQPPEEWRSADLDSTLRKALGWGGCAERLTHATTPPTSLEILGELGDCWSNFKWINRHEETAGAYCVRGGKSPAFWIGPDDRRPPLEGAELVEHVRRVLGLPAEVAAKHEPDYDGPAPRKRHRKRKEAGSAGT